MAGGTITAQGSGIYYAMTVYLKGRVIERIYKQDILEIAEYVKRVLSRGRSSGCKVRAYAYDWRDIEMDELLCTFKNSYLRTLCRS